MTAKKTAVFCIFPDRTGFEYAVCALKFAGFHESEISGMFQPDAAPAPMAATGSGEAARAEVSDGEINAAFGWLAEARAMHTGVDGMFLISGPLLPTDMDLESLRKEGGVTDALLAAGLPKAETKRFGERIKEGGILLCVICRHPSWADKAAGLLGSTGAETILKSRKHVTPRRLESA